MLPDSKPMPNQSINICHLSSFPIISIRHENHHPLYSYTTSVLPRSRVLSYHISSFRHEAEAASSSTLLIQHLEVRPKSSRVKLVQ